MGTYDIAIVGGGVAGYFAAIQLLEQNVNYNILLLEKEKNPLQKLLITGSGSCNFSHTGSIEDFILRYGKNGQFLRNAFYNYFVDDIVHFFEDNNIKTLCRKDGKYFPASLKANDIKNLFLEKTKNITTKCSSQVKTIENINRVFVIRTDDNTFEASNVVVATGGMSFPKTGSTGDGYNFAKKLGHTIEPLRSALASIYCSNHPLGQFSGIAFESAKVTSSSMTYKGSLLITHKGFSGPVIIDNSRDFKAGDSLTISFVDIKKEELEASLKDAKNETITSILKTYELPKKLIHFICIKANIDSTKKICEISYKNLEQLIDCILSYPITISNIENFDTCMCTKGGISLKDINPKTFESKLMPHLYFLGEVLDIDGDSGGYNLQAIWSECALFAKAFAIV